MTGAIAIGVPGWPELACCTASMHKVRMVLTQMSSIVPVGMAMVCLFGLVDRLGFQPGAVMLACGNDSPVTISNDGRALVLPIRIEIDRSVKTSRLKSDLWRGKARRSRDLLPGFGLAAL